MSEHRDDPIDDTARLTEPTLRELDNIVGLHISLAHAAVYRHFMETFAHLELTQKQVAVLWLVGDFPGIAQTDIARLLKMDRATIMAIVNRLQARDYLVRGKTASDRRRQSLDLTQSGEAALDVAKAAIRAHEDWLKSRFNAKDIKKLVEMLKLIHE